MALPKVVIVGRPNVGKSSLLNMLARERISIVDPRAGITRDRVAVTLTHEDRHFELIDTGGIGIIDDDKLEAHVEEQIEFAIRQADLILFVVDAQQGMAALDQQVVERLRTLNRPMILVANKCDAEPHQIAAIAEFAPLGFGEPLAVSALHARGRRELLARIAEKLPEGIGAPPEPPAMRLAIVGKRNAGKSTLVNALAGEDRVIVSEVPGTTRDAVDVEFQYGERRFVAIDTAGVRKKKSMDDIDYYAYDRALRSVRRADVVMHLIDAVVPVSEVDLKLASAVLEEHKPVVLVVNKWDLVAGRATPEDFAHYLTQVIPYMRYAPIVLITAKTGQNLRKAVDTALSLYDQANTRVTTGQLNSALEAVLAERGPSAKRGTKRVRIYYATQTGVSPPTVVFFCNDPSAVQENYRRYMENRLRTILPFREIPIRMMFRGRGKGEP